MHVCVNMSLYFLFLNSCLCLLFLLLPVRV